MSAWKVKVSLIAMETSVGDQVVFDIGERTFDMVITEGQRLTASHCKGKEIGVGQLVDDLVAFGKSRRLPLEGWRMNILRAYAHNSLFQR